MDLCIRKRVLESVRVTSHNTIPNETNQKTTETPLPTRCKQMSQGRPRRRWSQIRKRHFVPNRSQTSISCVHISQWYRCRQEQSGPIALTILSAKFVWYPLSFAPCLFLFPKPKARINNDTAFSNYSHSLPSLLIVLLGSTGSDSKGISFRGTHVRDFEDIASAYASMSQVLLFGSASRVGGLSSKRMWEMLIDDRPLVVRSAMILVANWRTKSARQGNVVVNSTNTFLIFVSGARLMWEHWLTSRSRVWSLSNFHPPTRIHNAEMAIVKKQMNILTGINRLFREHVKIQTYPTPKRLYSNKLAPQEYQNQIEWFWKLKLKRKSANVVLF